MKHKVISATLASCLCMGSFTALADSHGMTTMQLAEEKKCMGCHTTSEELPRVPSFPSIAQRYTMEEYDRLVQVVLTGGEDHWGSAKMPEMDARAEVSQEEAEKLVTWIFDMKE
ncbi:c-type cytochrome [Marinobacter sediminum]|uniref:c-type cytochrome n=1 Tax=Marinobacter sediminum TaxID=256323 RepID=UPI00202EDAAF|nr:c-type cytochrome [Marinobacter sediminum]MCM0612046.1 c-type cytochrome [Marinobacter sediminum]